MTAHPTIRPARSIVAIGIANGWIKFRQHEPMPEKKSQSQFRDEWRQRNIAKGLTSEGKVRQKRVLPELKGLIGKEYRHHYYLLMRERFLAMGLTTHGKQRKHIKQCHD